MENKHLAIWKPAEQLELWRYLEIVQQLNMNKGLLRSDKHMRKRHAVKNPENVRHQDMLHIHGCDAKLGHMLCLNML